MKFDKESKGILPYFLIAFVMILLTYGFKKGLITMSAFFILLCYCGSSRLANCFSYCLYLAW